MDATDELGVSQYTRDNDDGDDDDDDNNNNNNHHHFSDMVTSHESITMSTICI